MQWLLRFSEERIESGLSWDIRRDIGGLSQEIFNETYKSFRDELLKITADKTFLREYAKKLRTVRKIFETEVVACAERALALMQGRGLSPDRFKSGSRSPFFLFEKWRAGVMKEPTETFIRLADNLEGWFTRKTDDTTVEAIRQVYGEGLNDCVKKMVDLYGKGGYERYLTAVETGRYLFTLGILSDIDRHIQAYQQEHNLLLLSDTADLLHRIIDDSDTPFVYEKIGTRIEHFMIDEFQDTSNLQWENFRPLFRESLDKGQSCLIVGDVKQSIYRWRNSDWRLLASGLRRSFDASKCEEQLLNTNYRSCKQIVAFNNSFFTAAAQLLQDKFNALLDAGACSGDREPLSTCIVDAYGDVPQQVSPAYESSDGHVQISFIDAPSTDDFKEEVLGRIPDLLIRLQQNGYRLRDMAFLVRNKADGVLIADTLLRYKASCRDERFRFDIISDESLYISSSPSVRFLVNMLAYLYNPKETLRSILATYEYEISQSGTTVLLVEQNAKKALSYGVLSKGKDCDFSADYEDSLLLHLIGNIKSKEGLEELIPASLEKLEEYDRKHNTELLDTLSIYFNCNCNMKKSAQAMTIHYKTMVYRMNQISGLCETDFSNSDVRLRYGLGIKLFQLLKGD